MALGAQGKNLNAKKLDINFDCDDFFNSFEPVTTAPKPKIDKPKETTSLTAAAAGTSTANEFDASSWSFGGKKEETGMATGGQGG